MMKFNTNYFFLKSLYLLKDIGEVTKFLVTNK